MTSISGTIAIRRLTKYTASQAPPASIPTNWAPTDGRKASLNTLAHEVSTGTASDGRADVPIAIRLVPGSGRKRADHTVEFGFRRHAVRPPHRRIGSHSKTAECIAKRLAQIRRALQLIVKSAQRVVTNLKLRTAHMQNRQIHTPVCN